MTPYFKKFLFFGAFFLMAVVVIVSGCTVVKPKVEPANNQVVAACPDRSQIPAPKDFGDTSLQLIDAERQYGECRAAALRIKK
jgi:hypothetical protein